MPSLRTWLLPSLVGPFATMWSLTTLLFLLAGQAQILGERLDAWALAMLLTGFIAAGHAVALLASDVLLLKLKLRRLPTGARAWASSMLSPFALQMLLMIPIPVESFFGMVVWLGASMLGAAIIIRLALGTSPAR